MHCLVYTSDCGTVVTHRPSDMKVSPCKGSNPTPYLLSLWQTEAIYSQMYMKVSPCKGSNPTPYLLSLWQTEAIYSQMYIMLGW